MQRLRRISRSRHLYCLLLQLLVILAGAARISETGVSGAAGQRVSGGNAAVAAAAARLFAQRLTSISSALSRARNIKGAAKTSAIISGREGDTKLEAREKAKELNLPDDWDVLVGDGRGSLVGGKEVAGVLVKFQMKEYFRNMPRDKVQSFINAIARFIMNGRLRGVFQKYFESEVGRKEKVYTALAPIDQGLLIYIVREDLKDNEKLLDDHVFKDGLVKEKKEMFSSIRRKRFLHEVNTDEQSGLKNRQKRHSWHFMGDNFWPYYASQSYLYYSGVPYLVQWPPMPLGFSPHKTQFNCETWKYGNGPWDQDSTGDEWQYPNDSGDWHSDSDDNNGEKVPKDEDGDSDISKEDKSNEKDSAADDSNNRKENDSNGKKLNSERLKTGGLSQMLQYNRNTYKKNQPLDHLKSHRNPPWPQKNIVGIPSVNKHKRPTRRTKYPKIKTTSNVFNKN